MDTRELERRLRAIREPDPPADLVGRLERGIPDASRRPAWWWGPGRVWAMAKIVAVFALVLGAAWVSVTLVIAPALSTPAFAVLLEPVVRATAEVDAVHVVMQVRNRQGEDFSFVDFDGEPMRLEAWIRWPRLPGDPGRMRIEKADRVFVFDGAEAVLYRVATREAFRGRGWSQDVELFWPAAWVRQIQSLPTRGVEVVEHEESAGRGRLLLRERGVETAPRQPAFLGEFDRETEVEWDLESHLLLGLRRWVYRDGERRLYSELESVEYPPEIPEETFRIELPEDVRWGGVERAPLELLDLGPRETARLLFAAAIDGDRETLRLLCASPATVDWLLDEERRPQKVYFLGEPFRAGTYAGVYVPYKVRFGKGPFGVKRHDLALRNDNEQNRWVFDGGI